MSDLFFRGTIEKVRFSLPGLPSINMERLFEVDYNILAEYEAILKAEATVVTDRRKSSLTKEQATKALRLDIVSAVLNYKEANSDRAIKATETREYNQSIMEFIKLKRDEELRSLSIAELEAKLIK